MQWLPFQLPSLDPPTVLGVAAVVMLACAAVMLVVGLTQRVYRGFWAWTAAQGAGCLAAGLGLWVEPGWAVWPVAELATMAWSLLILEGMRRFCARRAPQDPPRTSPRTDLLVFAAAAVTLLASVWLRERWADWRRVYDAAGVLLPVYVAAVVWSLPQRRRSGPVALLALAIGATALTRLPRLAESWSGGRVDLGSALPAPAPGAVLMFLVAAIAVLCLCLVLTHVRTEHELRASHQRLRLLANIDMLTSVPNRRHLQELAEELLSSSTQPSALMIFDIDHFKQINDRHGHAVGDAALRTVAHEAREALRAQDVLGRLGGDEFVALLPATPVDAALRGAERITQRILRAAQAQRLPALTISVGVVTALPNESLSAVLARADSALYEAKRQGRGRAVLAEVGQDTPVFSQSLTLALMPDGPSGHGSG